MKKWISLLLAIILCLTAVSCGKSEDTDTTEETQPKVIEITKDNWQDYFEIRECFSFYYMQNAFGEYQKATPTFKVVLKPKDEFKYRGYSDFAAEYNADYCPKDVVYNYDDFSYEIKDCQCERKDGIDETKFVRGATGWLMGEYIYYDKIENNKVISEYENFEALAIYGNTSYMMTNLFIDNSDGTGHISYYPVNIEIVKIQGKFEI